MKRFKMFGVVVLVVAILSGAKSTFNTPEQELCVSRTPEFESHGPGYELIDMWRGEAWATRNWTPEAYAAFSSPLSWSFWIKNDPRVAVAERSMFSRSPGCTRDGQYSYMTAFGRTFVHVARLHDTQTVTDDQGDIRAATVEKHHVLRFSAGQTVSILFNPAGEQFIEVTRPLRRALTAPELPVGWVLENRAFSEDLEVALIGDVAVLRLTNGVSYQGPLLFSEGILRPSARPQTPPPALKSSGDE